MIRVCPRALSGARRSDAQCGGVKYPLWQNGTAEQTGTEAVKPD
jgi:hypothetical protein